MVNFAQTRASPAASLLSPQLHPSLYTIATLTDIIMLFSRLEKTLQLCYPAWIDFFFFTLFLPSDNFILKFWTFSLYFTHVTIHLYFTALYMLSLCTVGISWPDLPLPD